MPGQHSDYAPSSADIWMNCAASVGMCRQAPARGGSKSAHEGTAAHILLETCLSQGVAPASFVGQSIQTAEDGVVMVHEVTVDMARHVNIAVLYLHQLLSQGGTAFFEQRVSLGQVVDVWGTADIIHIGLDGILTIIDLKYGRMDVAVEENKQFLIYGLSALDTVVENRSAITHIRFVVVQPRSVSPGPPVKQDIKPVAELEAFVYAVSEAVGRSKVPNPEFKTGSWCRFCDAGAWCPTYSADLSRAADLLANVAPEDMYSQDIEYILERKKMLEDRFDDLKDEGTRRMNAGQPVGNMKMVTSQTRRTFPNKDVATNFFATKYGMAAVALKTPAQLEKLSDEAAKDVKTMQHKPPGQPILALAGDSRPPHTTEKSFDQVFLSTERL